MAKSAAERAARYHGFEVIKDTVEIDEDLHNDGSTTIEDCFGYVLIEVPRADVIGMTSAEIFERAQELASESTPYGVESITWKHAYEGVDAFVRFTVESYETTGKGESREDAEALKADEHFEAAREVANG